MQLVIRNITAFVGSNFERRDGIDVLIEDDRIIKVGEKLAIVGCPEIDGTDFFMTPGFINSHFHPTQQLNRALAVSVDQRHQMDLLHATDRIKDPESKYCLSLIAILEGVKAGTTSFYSVGSDIEAQVKAFTTMGIRAACTMIPKDLEANEKPAALRAPTWNTKERLETAESFHKLYHGNLVRVHFGVCNVRYASDELISGMYKLAERYDVGFHLHAAEGNDYYNEVLRRTGDRYIEHLYKLGALSARTSLAHATKITPPEIELIAKTKASVVHCPRANAYVGVGTCPVPELLAAGVNVALGSDAAINNNSNEVRGEAMAAYLVMASKHERADITNFRTLFQMLTINGARAMGLSKQIGTIEVGKKADLVLWSKNDTPFIPGHNYLADLIFTDSCRAHTVIVNGQKVLENYNTTLLDEKELITRARKYSEQYREAFEKSVKQHIDAVHGKPEPATILNETT
jgi:5-methylthioadenosine/S-adenosylhomocysteine deaminase